MSAHLVVKRLLGKLNYSIEIDPEGNRPRPKHERFMHVARYALTDEQAALKIDELIVLCAENKLTKWEPPPPVKKQELPPELKKAQGND